MKVEIFAFAVFATVCVVAAEKVDVLVVGGTVRGVEEAVKAGRELSAGGGAGKVLLITPRPYLGDDMAGTLELDFDGRRRDADPLVRRMWLGETDHIDYTYTHPEGFIYKGGWQFHNDSRGKFFNEVKPMSPWDTVLYLEKAVVTCTFAKEESVGRVEAVVLENPDPEGLAEKAVDHRGWIKPGSGKGPFTGRVTLTVLDGPRKGAVIELGRGPREFVEGDSIRAGEPMATGSGQHGANMITYSAPVGFAFTSARLEAELPDGAACQLLSRIYFRRKAGERTVAVPSPIKVKKTLDAYLVENGVEALTSVFVTGVLRGSDGSVIGVKTVSRSGEDEIHARRVLDCTRYGALAAVEKGGFEVGPEEEFTRVVLTDGEIPYHHGMKVERLGFSRPIPGTPLTIHAFRCTMKLPMKDGTYRSFAAAEWKARDMTACRGMLDEADMLVWVRGEKVRGEKAMAAARPSASADLDVVVIGGGTSGAPAGIAAGRAGAKTMVVEGLGILGGIGTDGMILGYYDGNHCGFFNEFWEATQVDQSRYGLYRRWEMWRRYSRDAGVEVVFGAMGLKAETENGRVRAALVATPMGLMRVGAKAFVDATGGADFAAAAGAGTELFSTTEFAVQSAGEAPKRIGIGGANSDFGYLDDSDARDLSTFMRRARAGAPSGAWDIAKFPDSRERRRVISDYPVSGMDVAARRRFPDTVVQPMSRQDSHGYFVDDFSFISEISATTLASENAPKPRQVHNVNLPLRSVLPKGLSGLAVIGTGVGVCRDVQPIVRMQADLMNMGYSIGTAAAMAAKETGGDYRALDVKALQRRLVDFGILRPEVLDWKEEEDVSSGELVEKAVAACAKGMHLSHVIWRRENRARALPLLRRAFAAAKTCEARENYALILALMGDAAGADLLADILLGLREPSGRNRSGAFGGNWRIEDGYMLALGRTKSPRAKEVFLKELAKLDPGTSMNDVRGVTLGIEACGAKELAPELAAVMKRCRYTGYSVASAAELPPLGGYVLGFRTDKSVRELAFARALYACGDHGGLAKSILEAYTADPRRILARNARAILKTNFPH